MSAMKVENISDYEIIYDYLKRHYPDDCVFALNVRQLVREGEDDIMDDVEDVLEKYGFPHQHLLIEPWLFIAYERSLLVALCNEFSTEKFRESAAYCFVFQNGEPIHENV